jgi:hypothetical protein
MTKVFAVAADGSISASDEQARPPVARESRIPDILEKLRGPKFSAAEVARFVAEEIVLLVQEMSRCADDPAATFKQNNCRVQIEALRTTERLLEKSNHDSDGLNFDGPEFVWAFKGIVHLLMQALKSANGDSYQKCSTDSIMRHFGSLLAAGEMEIRKSSAAARNTNQGTWNDAIRNIK